MASQANVQSSEENRLTAQIMHNVNGSCIYGCQYGDTSLDSSVLEDCKIPTSIMCFQSINDAKEYAIPLRFFANNRYINNIFHVTEATNGPVIVIVENIKFDLHSFIDTLISKMDASKQNYWFKYAGQYHTKIYRGLVTAMLMIILQPVRKFNIPSLMGRGVVSIDSYGAPKITKLTASTNPNHSSTIKDLGDSMEYFVTRGAIKMMDSLPWQNKFKLLDAPDALIRFIEECKNWPSSGNNLRYSLGGNFPIVWLLDTSTIWPTDIIVEWVYRMSDMVIIWRQDQHLANKLDFLLKERLDYNEWGDFIPKSGPTKDLYMECLAIFDEHARRKGNHYRSFHFHNLVKFFRHMFEHYVVNGKKEKDREIIEELDRHFASVSGLCNVLRDVVGQVFCLDNNYSIGSPWINLMSSTFVRIVRHGEGL